MKVTEDTSRIVGYSGARGTVAWTRCICLSPNTCRWQLGWPLATPHAVMRAGGYDQSGIEG